ncbi:urease accessory protein UreE [Phenylobacterium sp. LjRoot225]|uniref:urease accessory protein UreE n=1 Tax=Phenylobacterium sp. LjRoot225 TaxID=3342285 RepID=UPI003ECCA5C4
MSETADIAPIVEILPAKAWAAAPADRVRLDYDGRRRRRIVLTGMAGARYLLDLPETAHLRHGDALKLADGRLVEVEALAEPLLEIRAASTEALLRLSWHIGNRHLAAAVFADRILIRRDHVIAHMLEHQGAQVREVEAIFDPEGGAYHDHAPHSHEH